MKLLAFSDLHLDAVTFGKLRLPELVTFFGVIRKAVEKEEIDIVIVSGDFFDPGSMMGPAYAALLIEQFVELATSTNQRMLIAIAGNHDVIEVDRALSTLAPVRAAFDAVAVPEMAVVVAEKPQLVRHRHHSFLLLPFLSRAYVETEAAKAALDQAFTDARDTKLMSADEKLIVVGHLTIPGAIIGSESVEMSRGRDYDLPVARIAELKPDLVINGHYHRPQLVNVGPFEVVIPGSPLAYAVDDEAKGKGFVILEV